MMTGTIEQVFEAASDLVLKVVSPEGTLLDTQADSVQLPARMAAWALCPGTDMSWR